MSVVYLLARYTTKENHTLFFPSYLPVSPLHSVLDVLMSSFCTTWIENIDFHFVLHSTRGSNLPGAVLRLLSLIVF
jgi:hypothetical protein